MGRYLGGRLQELEAVPHVPTAVVWNIGRGLHDERLDHNQTKGALQHEKERRVAAEENACEMKR